MRKLVRMSLRAASEPGAHSLLGSDVMGVLSSHPEIHGWLPEADAQRIAAGAEGVERTARKGRARSARRPRRPGRA